MKYFRTVMVPDFSKYQTCFVMRFKRTADLGGKRLISLWRRGFIDAFQIYDF